MLYLPVKHGVGHRENVPTSAKSGGSTWSTTSIDNAEQYKHDTQNTYVIVLSADEDDTPSIVRSPKVQKQKVWKSPTIVDMLVTQRKMNFGISFKVGHRSHVALTPPKAGRHGGFRSGHVPTPLAVREHASYARTEARKAALERFVVRFPDVDPSLEPMKPNIPPGLYILAVQSGDIVTMDLITDLLAHMKEIRNLYEADKLDKKVFGAWGVLQCMPELTVSLFYVVFI